MADRVVGVLVGEPDEAELLVRLLGAAGIEAGILDSPAALDGALDEGLLSGVVIAATVDQVSGVRLLQALRGRKDSAMSKAPLVLLAEQPLGEHDRRAVDELGATMLQKPFHVDELLRALGAS